MRKLYITIALILFASTGVAAQTPAADLKVEQELLQVNRELLDAYNRRDKAAILGRLVTGFFETEPNGAIFDAESVAARAENNPVGLKITEDVRDVRLLVAGDTAVLSYRSNIRLRGAGMDGSSASRITNVYLRQRGHWFLATIHHSLLPAAGTTPRKVAQSFTKRARS